MKIPWLWIKKNVLKKNVQIDFFLEKLNYLGLECEKFSSEQNEDILINFLPVSNRKDLNSWLGIANEISLISDFSDGISSIIQGGDDDLELEKKKIAEENFSLLILKDLNNEIDENNFYLKSFNFLDLEKEENKLNIFLKIIELQTSYNVEIVSPENFQMSKDETLLKINKEKSKKNVSLIKEKDFFLFFSKQAKLFFKKIKIEVCFLSRDFFSNANKEKVIELNHSYLEDKLGIHFSKHEILNVIKKIGFEFDLSEEKNSYLIKIPFYRKDLLEKDDLIEEIGKSFDYNKIPAINCPSINNFENSLFEKKRLLKEKITSYFVNLGFYEVVTYSLVSKEMLIHEEKNLFKILNPRSLNHEIYRQFIFPSHIELFKNVFGKGFEDISFFEISKIYIKDESNQPIEKEKISLSFAVENRNLNKKNDSFNLVKKLFENLFSRIGIENYLLWKECEFNFLKEGLKIEVKNENVGFIGFLDDKFSRNKGFIEKSIMSCEIEIDRILEISIEEKKRKNFVSFLKSPIIKKDLSFFVSKGFNTNEIKFFIKKWLFENDIFVFDIELIDIYENTEIESHSLCFRLEFSAQKINLENKKINQKIENLFDSLEKEFKVIRR